MALYRNIGGLTTIGINQTPHFEYYYGGGDDVGPSVMVAHFTGQPGGEGALTSVEQGKIFNAVPPYYVYEAGIRNDSPWPVQCTFDVGNFQ
jgi:hypothetical protein